MAIGDVMGHDIEAAAAMAQVRAGLRAYAWEGEEPAAVIGRLAALVDAFDVTALVTVIYGVLAAPNGNGARWFQWANAGHLPPLLISPEGQVDELRDGKSAVIGALGDEPRSQGRRLLAPGSTMVLYTDGLVERPGVALAGSIEQLRASLQQKRSGNSANDLCDGILGANGSDERRDDTAIVVLRLLSADVGTAGRASRNGLSCNERDSPRSVSEVLIG